MKRSAQLAAVVLAVSAAACASILGIEDGILDSDGGDGGVVICTTDSGVQVDTSQVFVSAYLGNDDKGCGTSDAPCKTIGAGLAAIGSVRDGHLIYVGEGEYDETIHLLPNVEIQGGWHPRGQKGTPFQWQQVCASTEENQFANIVGTEGIVVHAENINGSAILTSIVIKTKPSPDPGESVYGIFASGTTSLTLNDVLIHIGNAGNGESADAGDNGAPGSGTCAAGSGATPEAGASGNGAPATTYGPTGAVPVPATSGQDGTAGSNGTSGIDGGCVSCVVCTIIANCGGGDGTSCGDPGLSGCAGARGSGGRAGQSGGSAFGVYAWGASVTVNAGSVKVGNGGRGGNGGLGGQGGPGSPGVKGADGRTCHTGCNGGCTSAPTDGMGNGGAAGGNGGAGSNGGQGGGGAGGDSFAFVSGIDASIAVDAAVTIGNGGQGGDLGGATGKASVRFP